MNWSTLLDNKCCRKSEIDHPHTVCWRGLSISDEGGGGGGLSSACPFQSNPRKLMRGKLLMKHTHIYNSSYLGNGSRRHLEHGG